MPFRKYKNNRQINQNMIQMRMLEFCENNMITDGGIKI
jgi:hypothetical protein